MIAPVFYPMEYFITSAPARMPIELSDLKDQLEILDDEHDNAKLLQYIAACVGAVEKAYTVALITQSRTMYFDGWQRRYRLYGYPVQSILSVTYTDIDGVTTTLPATEYQLVRSTGDLLIKSTAVLPSVTLADAEAIAINYRCGFGDAPVNVPAEVRQVLLLLGAHFFAHREQVILGQISLEPKALEWGVDRLMAPYTIPR